MADNDKNVEKAPVVRGDSAPQKLTADTDYIKKNNDAGKVRLIKQYALYLADSNDTAFVMPTSTEWTPPEGHFPIGYSKEDGAVLHPETGDETEIKAHNGDIVYSSVDGGYWTLHEQFSRIRFLEADISVFGEFPEWRRESYMYYADKGAAFITIAASDPEIMKGVDKEKLALNQKTAGGALIEYRERLMSNKNRWCVISIPTKSWAKKVFPHLSEEDAFNALEKAIYKASRTEGNAIGNWKAHIQNLHKKVQFLNEHNFKYLKYKNSLGTDLTIKLPENHIWAGGAEIAEDGVEFAANIPSEEVYTMPHRDGAEGVVVASKPLVYQGNLIEDFSLTFKNGKVVYFKAKKNKEILENLLNTDEGARFLGEVALVPYDSPISNSGILFYNTLFDENASCHLALGKAYSTCLKGGEDMDSVTLLKNGANDSMVHEDFMIGTADLSVIGVTYEGEEIQVMKNGNFAF